MQLSPDIRLHCRLLTHANVKTSWFLTPKIYTVTSAFLKLDMPTCAIATMTCALKITIKGMEEILYSTCDMEMSNRDICNFFAGFYKSASDMETPAKGSRAAHGEHVLLTLTSPTRQGNPIGPPKSLPFPVQLPLFLPPRHVISLSQSALSSPKINYRARPIVRSSGR